MMTRFIINSEAPKVIVITRWVLLAAIGTLLALVGLGRLSVTPALLLVGIMTLVLVVFLSPAIWNKA